MSSNNKKVPDGTVREDDGKLLGVFTDHFSSAVQPNPLPIPSFYSEIHRLHFCTLHHCKYMCVLDNLKLLNLTGVRC